MEGIRERNRISNEVELRFSAKSVNEGFARVAVAAFVTALNPTLEELSDIKTAVSEAVTNCIIHGYENHGGVIVMRCQMEGNEVNITITDKGVGMEDVERAMEPLYTSKPELERSGMGFSFMEAFMDHLEVDSRLGAGTTVRMSKKIGSCPYIIEDDED